MKLRILHLANFNSTNIGNGALIYGTEQTLKEDLGPDVEFVPEAWDDYTFGLKTFDQAFVDLINEHDGLIVNGAVTFNGRAYLKNAGMRFDLPLELWPQIKKPVVFYGLSYRVWPGQTYFHKDKLVQALNYILSRSDMILAVRNDGTKDWLGSFVGINTEKIVEVPDPALFVPTERYQHPELAKDKLNVIVALNNEDEVYRFGGPLRVLFWKLTPFLSEKHRVQIWNHMPLWYQKKHRLLKAIASSLEQLALTHKANIILTPHYFDDYKMLDELVVLTKPHVAHQQMVSSGLVKVTYTPYFYDRYSQADLAISMRVHSISPSIGLGVPVVPIVSQNRIKDFLQGIGLSHLAVDMSDPQLSKQLTTAIEYALSHKVEIQQKMAAAKQQLRNQTKKFNMQVARLLGL